MIENPHSIILSRLQHFRISIWDTVPPCSTCKGSDCRLNSPVVACGQDRTFSLWNTIINLYQHALGNRKKGTIIRRAEAEESPHEVGVYEQPRESPEGLKWEIEAEKGQRLVVNTDNEHD